MIYFSKPRSRWKVIYLWKPKNRSKVSSFLTVPRGRMIFFWDACMQTQGGRERATRSSEYLQREPIQPRRVRHDNSVSPLSSATCFSKLENKSKVIYFWKPKNRFKIISFLIEVRPALLQNRVFQSRAEMIYFWKPGNRSKMIYNYQRKTHQGEG